MDKIASLLQELLIDEHTASQLYATFGAILDNDEIKKLADHFKSESSDEVKHAQAIRERLLVLGQYPTIGVNAEKVDKDPLEMMSHTKTLEEGAVIKYNKLYKMAMDEGDSVTARLATEHAADEEEHREFAKGQLNLSEDIGDAIWLQKWL